MDLAILQALPAHDKLTWLKSSEGLTQLNNWLSEGLRLSHIAESQLLIGKNTIYSWRYNYPVIAEVIALYIPPQGNRVMPANLSRQASYMIVTGIDYSHQRHRGRVLGEYQTAKDLWDSEFIQSYFDSFSTSGVYRADYFKDYLQKVLSGEIYRLSNLYCVVYAEVSRKEIIKSLKPPIA